MLFRIFSQISEIFYRLLLLIFRKRKKKKPNFKFFDEILVSDKKNHKCLRNLKSKIIIFCCQLNDTIVVFIDIVGSKKD